MLLYATTVIPMDVDKLASVSTHIVEARAVQSVSQWNADHTLILTYTQFAVTRTLKGQAPATFMVRQLGRHGGRHQRRKLLECATGVQERKRCYSCNPVPSATERWLSPD